MTTVIIKSEHSELTADSNHLISLIREGLEVIHQRVMDFPGETWEFAQTGIDTPAEMVDAAHRALQGLEFDRDTLEAGRAVLRTIQVPAENSDGQPF